MDVAKKIKRLTRSPAQRAVAQADALRDGGDWPGAAGAYSAALDLDPGRDAIWVQYGHALKESGRVDEAEAAYRRAIAIDDGVADTHLQLGHALKIGGRPDEAANAYMRALELDHSLPDAIREIQDLALRGTPVPADRLETVMGRLSAGEAPVALSAAAPHEPAELATALERLRLADLGPDDRAMIDAVAARLRTLAADGPKRKEDGQRPDIPIVFDASDLIHHLRHSRLPTGIQRVQLEIVRSAVRADPEGVQICASDHDRWVHVPTSLFLSLADLSTLGGDDHAPDWRTAATRLEVALRSDRSYRFPRGACLVNLGTSWHVNYLLKVRNAKREHGIRFIPFVHDLIPIVAPRYVLPDLVCDYVAWLLSVFDHADFFLTNSRSTRADLIAAAHRLGHGLAEEDVLVVPLDARFSAPEITRESRRDILREKGLYGQPYVLFVSTIEPRKNHLAAIHAWAALLGEFGARMPRLVCVGGRGWMNDDVFQLIASDELLARHVTFLHGLSDVELAACYDACLFTLFPSHYEGWGLPVTESLCHGKVPLLSDGSSLPEAGGPFAVYFENGSQPALVEALRKLIGDPDHRLDLERRIAAEFEPRRWDQLAEQIGDAITDRFGRAPAKPLSGIADIRLGSFYGFGRSTARRLRPGLVSGYALRAGTEWHMPEDWGSWARGSTVALSGRFPEATPVRAFLGVRGMPGGTTHLTLIVDGNEMVETQIPGSETRWLPFRFDPGAGPTRIELRSDRVQKLDAVTDGEDTRTVGPGLLGFYACAVDDLGGRLAFVEALATGVLAPGALDSDIAIDTPRAPAARDAVDQASLPAGSRTRLDELPIEPNATRDEILLLQSSDAEVYAPMLAQSARTTRAYAERHGYRYESFIGIKRGCLPWHAIYNRIDLLMDLIAADYQGWVLYMDADAWIVDQGFDLRGYLADKRGYALIASPAENAFDAYWNVNNGVILFNLGHPFARALITEWERFLSRFDIAAEAKSWNVEISGDQGMFHQILDKLPYAAELVFIEDKALLNSPWARFVRHALRAENTDFEKRLALMAEEIDGLLERPVAEAVTG